MNSYQCNSTENVFLISDLCLERYDLDSVQCVVAYDTPVLIFRYIEGYFLAIIAVICGICNVITLLSVSIANKRRRHGFDKKFRQITIFIVYLSLIDLCWSLTCAWPLSYELIAMRWPFGKAFCSLKVICAATISLVEVQTIALIAISRYLDLTKSSLWRRWTESNVGLTVSFLIPWILSLIVTVLPWVPSMEIAFTWNCFGGGCGAVSTSNDDGSESPGVKFVSIYMFLFTLFSVFVVGIFYYLLRKDVKTSTKYLKENVEKCETTSANVASKIDDRELKMTRTILMLTGVHAICNIPMVVFQMIPFGPQENTSMIVWHLIMIIWTCQFSVNFFIYAGSNEQYQMAYLDLRNIFIAKMLIAFK